MSFQINNITEGTIGYNYYRTSIHKYQNTIANNQYVKATISSKPNEPNVSFLEKGYLATSISIVQPIHVIQGVSYDATLVIEHTSVTNQTEPLYVCLLLKTAPNTRSPIDDIVEGKLGVELVLNGIIESDTAILYNNHFIKNAVVAIFTKPILVGSRFSKLRSGNLYIAPYSETYKTITVEPILGGFGVVEGFVEGNTTQQMAGYCTPISETDPDVTNSATIMLDANSSLAANSSINTTLATATNFFGFFMLMLFAVFATPAGYKYLLVELVLDNDTFDPQMKLNRMSAVDMVTSILIFSFAFAFINYGITNGSTSSLLIGFYVFLFFLTSLIVLQYNRIFNENEYLEQFGVGSSIPSFKNIRNDLGGLIYDNVRELFFVKKTIKDGNETITVNEVSYSGALLLGIYLAFYLILYYNNMWSSKSSFYFISIPVAFFFLAWYLVVLINHFWNMYTKPAP